MVDLMADLPPLENATLDALEAALAKATAKPWSVSDGCIVQTQHVTRDVWTIPRTDDDLAAIVLLRNTAEALIARLRAVEALASRLGKRKAKRKRTPPNNSATGLGYE